MIGGSPNTNDHSKGYAVDFRIPEEFTSYVFNWCLENLEEWKDLMWAYPERGIHQSWIHISYKEGSNIKNKILASEREDIHKFYGDIRRGPNNEYQDNIITANQDLI